MYLKTFQIYWNCIYSGNNTCSGIYLSRNVGDQSKYRRSLGDSEVCCQRGRCRIVTSGLPPSPLPAKVTSVPPCHRGRCRIVTSSSLRHPCLLRWPPCHLLSYLFTCLLSDTGLPSSEPEFARGETIFFSLLHAESLKSVIHIYTHICTYVCICVCIFIIYTWNKWIRFTKFGWKQWFRKTFILLFH